MQRWARIVVVVTLVAVAGCSSTASDGDAVVVASVDSTVVSAPPEPPEPPDTVVTEATTLGTDPARTSEPEEPQRGWGEIEVDSPDCRCSDGSEFTLYQRPGDPTKVMFYFEGGGACFNLATCDPAGEPTYSIGIAADVEQKLTERGGLFDATNPANPLADHSIVYVPYCTGDVHLGDATTDYGEGVVVEHRGAANARAALEYLVGTYPDAEQVLVTGASAGSVPTPVVAGLVSDRLPAAEIVTFGDSSGAYPDVPAVNELIGSLWGTTNAIPDWPENAGLTAADWSFPDLYVQAGLHAPNITFARFDYAFDEVQATFSALAGIGADAVVEGIDATEAQVEAGGSALATYVAPGTEHTIMGDDVVYEMEVEGVRLIDWITELVNGGVPADVHCVDCQS
jgi:Pectinacetylesterase